MNIQKLREIREDKDLKQIDVARILKTSQKQYSLYENGIRIIPIEKLDILANYYNTSVDYLIGRTDDRKPYPKAK